MGLSTKEVARLKQAEREKLVSEMEHELGLQADFTAEDKEFLEASASDVVANLKEGKEGWTCERVLTAYIRSACAAHRKTNCLTEILFREALADARAKDRGRTQTGKAEGTFFGLPASFKDTNNIVGVDTSLGCSPHCCKPTINAEDEAALVKIFRRAGGIPFCKTAIPQTLLAFECANPVFGVTSNPHSSARTCGGSSGGEAALLTLHGAAIGFGSDIGGSLRIPAAYSGCCGLKPTVGRWPMSGNRKVTFGFEGIVPVVGPMARNVDDLTFAAHGMIDNIVKEVDEKHFASDNVFALPWRDVRLPQKLRIGYWTDDGLVKTSPACARAVHETAAALRKAGHEVVECQLPPLETALKVFAALTSSDSYKQLLSNIGSDPMEPSMQLVVQGSKVPRALLWLAVFVIRYILKDEKYADILSTSHAKTAGEYWHWINERDVFCETFRKAVWEDQGFDFLLCPTQAVPALEHGRTKRLSPLCIGTVLFNVVDSTAGVVPVTRVDPDLDAAGIDYAAGSTGSWILEKSVYGSADPAYDAKKMAGLPVSVQLVGRRFEDEKVLAFMKIVEEAMGYNVKLA